MKKITLFILVALSLQGFSQINLNSDSIYGDFNPNSSDVALYNFFNVPATATDTIDVRWVLYSVDVPSTWENDAYICDLLVCHDTTVNSKVVTIRDDNKSTLDVHFYHNGSTGVGKATLLLYEVLDSANTFKFVTYVANVEEGVGINNIENVEFSIFPNPSSSFINLNVSDVDEIGKFEIYNVIGKKVFQENDIKTNNKISLSSFQNGLYIIKLYSTEGELFSTETFVKN